MKRVFIDTDRHNAIELPDGRLAVALRVGPLFAELQRLGIEGISPASSKSALLDAYAAHLTRIADALLPDHVKRIIPLPQETMREAAAFIEKRANI